jgi:hypothetical protein
MLIPAPVVMMLAQAAFIAGPSISETGAKPSYKGLYPSIQSVPFRDMALSVDGHWYPLKNGVFEFRAAGDYRRVELSKIQVIDGKTPSSTCTALSLRETTCGGSCANTGFVHVYAVEHGALTLKQELRYITDADGTGAWFDHDGQDLLIIARTDDGSPNCCPEHLDEARYHWDGSRYRLTGWKTVSFTKTEP